MAQQLEPAAQDRNPVVDRLQDSLNRFAKHGRRDEVVLAGTIWLPDRDPLGGVVDGLLGGLSP